MGSTATEATPERRRQERADWVAGIGDDPDEHELRDADKPRVKHSEYPPIISEEFAIHNQTEHCRELRKEYDR